MIVREIDIKEPLSYNYDKSKDHLINHDLNRKKYLVSISRSINIHIYF